MPRQAGAPLPDPSKGKGRGRIGANNPTALYHQKVTALDGLDHVVDALVVNAYKFKGFATLPDNPEGVLLPACRVD